MSDGCLADTSLWVALESGRHIDLHRAPSQLMVSVITIAELQAGVLAAPDTATRAMRMATLDAASRLEPLPVDGDVARHWAQLRVRLAEAKRRINVNDLWIAATAIAHGMPVATQDDDFDVLSELGLVEVVRV